MAIIGSILGDIAGSCHEFKRPESRDWKHMELFTDNNFFTYDTVLTCGTKLAIKNSGNKFSKYYRSICRRYPNLSYGNSFREWFESDDMPPYKSYGNGSAMRISPIIDAGFCVMDECILAAESAASTHNHEEGIKGVLVTAECIRMAKDGHTKTNILNYVNQRYPPEEYGYAATHDMKWLRKNYSWNDTCQGSGPVAIRCFIDSDSCEGFLRNVLSLYADADTLCCIGGGIAEEYYGKTGFDDDILLRRYLDDYLYGIVVS